MFGDLRASPVKFVSAALFAACALAASACLSQRPAPIPKANSLSGGRRGAGISEASLRQQCFALAHRVASAPAASQNRNEDPSLLLAEALWFAGDRDFARALSQEPIDVQRSVAKYIFLDGMLPNFPMTYSLLARVR